MEKLAIRRVWTGAKARLVRVCCWVWYRMNGRGWDGRAGDGRTTDDGAPTCEIFGPDQYIDER